MPHKRRPKNKHVPITTESGKSYWKSLALAQRLVKAGLALEVDPLRAFSLMPAVRIRAALIPPDCRNFIAEYLAEDDLQKHGKPYGIENPICRVIRRLKRELEHSIVPRRVVKAPRVVEFHGERRYSA